MGEKFKPPGDNKVIDLKTAAARLKEKEKNEKKSATIHKIRPATPELDMPDTKKVLPFEKRAACPCGWCDLNKEGISTVEVTKKITEILPLLPENKKTGANKTITDQNIKEHLSQKTLPELAALILHLRPDNVKHSPNYCRILFERYFEKTKKEARVHMEFIKKQKK